MSKIKWRDKYVDVVGLNFRADQGEPAKDGEALAVNGMRRRSGGCASKADNLTQGDLALYLKG